MFTNLKNFFTSKVIDKCVVKYLIAPWILGYSTLWFIINCNTYFRMMPFFYIHISQGSAATCLKHGGIFKHEFVANLLQSRLVKKFENRIIVSEVMAKSWVSCFFWLTVYIRSVDTNQSHYLSQWHVTFLWYAILFLLKFCLCNTTAVISIFWSQMQRNFILVNLSGQDFVDLKQTVCIRSWSKHS